jgi:hypothetical protein
MGWNVQRLVREYKGVGLAARVASTIEKSGIARRRTQMNAEKGKNFVWRNQTSFQSVFKYNLSRRGGLVRRTLMRGLA